MSPNKILETDMIRTAFGQIQRQPWSVLASQRVISSNIPSWQLRQIARCLAVAAATSAGREEVKIVSRRDTKREIDLGDDEFAPIRHSDRYSTGSRDGDDTILPDWRTAIAAERKRGPRVSSQRIS
jgi:hypothetical protein